RRPERRRGRRQLGRPGRPGRSGRAAGRGVTPGSHAVELADIGLPDFGLPAPEPSVPVATSSARIAAATAAAQAAGLDALVVYADREHFANLSFLTGFDPRFEEALLVLVPGRGPVLLAGNEGMAYTAVVPPEVEVI